MYIFFFFFLMVARNGQNQNKYVLHFSKKGSKSATFLQTNIFSTLSNPPSPLGLYIFLINNIDIKDLFYPPAIYFRRINTTWK